MKILKPEWDPTANVLLTYVNKLTYTLEGQKHARHSISIPLFELQDWQTLNDINLQKLASLPSFHLYR